MTQIICALMLMLVFSGCNWGTWFNTMISKSKMPATMEELKNLTLLKNEKKFTKFIKNPKLSIVMIHSTWCSSCKIMKPIFSTLASELNDTNCAIINLDEAPELAKSYKISGVPAFLVFENGKELSTNETRPMGDMSLNTLQQKIDEIVNEFHR